MSIKLNEIALRDGLTGLKSKMTENLTQQGVAPDETSLNTLADNILDIQSGGAWQPPADWPDIKTILQNDSTPDYGGKYIQLISDHNDTIALSSALAYRTSDGAFYTANTTHTWNKSLDTPGAMGFSTRWIVIYTNAESRINLQSNALWTVLDLMLNSVNSISGKRMLKAFEFLEGKNLSSGLTSAAGMFYNCSALTRVPDVLNLSGVTNVQQLFYNCYSLTRIPDVLDLSGVTNAQQLFYNCYSLTRVPDVLDLSGVTNTQQMFSSCSALTRVPDVLDLSSVTNAQNMFYLCLSLTRLPEILNLSGVTNALQMFYACYALSQFPGLLDLSGVTNAQNMFQGSPFIQSLKIHGAKTSLDLSPSTFFTQGDLLYTIQNLQAVTGETLTLGSVNCAKLSAGEIALATAKGWTVI